MEDFGVQHVIFIFVSLFTLGTATVVVTNRNLFHAALAMMASFAGVAGLYVLLEAGFLAAAQLLVYIGAISILMIFAIMMTRRLMQTSESPFNGQWIASAVVSLVVFGLMYLMISQFWGSAAIAPFVQQAPAISGIAIDEQVTSLGLLLASPDGMVIPFELISLLLLGALVGSIFIAHPKDE